MAATLEELIKVVVRPMRGLLTIGKATECLWIDVHTVKNWIEQHTYVEL